MSNKQKTVKQSKKGVESRKTALKILVRVDKEGAFSNIALAEAFSKSGLSTRDRAFVTCLVNGVARNRSSLDEKIASYSSRPLSKLPIVLKNILRLGFFQLEQLPEVPPSAVLDTCAVLARDCGHEGMVSFTSGILRNYLRKEPDLSRSDGAAQDNSETGKLLRQTARDLALLERITLALAEDDIDELERISSLPSWMLRRWQKNYPEDDAAALIKLACSMPTAVLRANLLYISIEGLQDILARSEIITRRSILSPQCLVVESRGKKQRGDWRKAPGFSEGLFSIQDEASALVAHILAPSPNETILDLCAAPGGKTLHMAELMENKGRVLAIDKFAKRLETLKKNRNRLGLTNIEIFTADATDYLPDGKIDKILIDAPCSGTGVMHRKPDLRHHRKESDLSSLVELQQALLDNAARILPPGGILVYSTCSVEPEENKEMIDWFLEKHEDFELDSLLPFVGEELKSISKAHPQLEKGALQILPSFDSTCSISGFFIARLKRTSST